MKLRFLAKPGLFERAPGMTPPGVAARYLGRELVAIDDVQVRYPAAEQAFEVDPYTPEGRSIVRQMYVQQPPPLWPADEQTAAYLGQTFVRTVYREGEHWPENEAPAVEESAPETDRAPVIVLPAITADASAPVASEGASEPTPTVETDSPELPDPVLNHTSTDAADETTTDADIGARKKRGSK